MNIVHIIAQLDDGSFAVLNDAGDEVTTFDLTDFSDPSAPADHIYAVRIAQVFRKIAAGDL